MKKRIVSRGPGAEAHSTPARAVMQSSKKALSRSSFAAKAC
jgi:hypothetical protein